MERIVYNSKLKKIIVSMFLFMILFNFIFPNIVEGYAIVSGGNKATGSIQDIIDSIRTYSGTGSGASGASGKKTIADWISMDEDTKNERISQVEGAVKEELKNKFASLEKEEDIDKIYRDYSENKEKIEVTVQLEGNSYLGYSWKSNGITVTINLTQADIDQTLGKSDEEIGEVETEGQVESNHGAAGENPDGGPMSNRR